MAVCDCHGRGRGNGWGDTCRGDTLRCRDPGVCDPDTGKVLGIRDAYIRGEIPGIRYTSRLTP